MCTRSCASSCIAWTTGGEQWPTASAPMPPTKSMKVLPSTSCTRAPSARSTTTSVALLRPVGTDAARRASIARLFGPGTSVFSRIDGTSDSFARPSRGAGSHGALDVPVRVEHDEHAVVIADRILQVVLEQRSELESYAPLHGEGGIVDSPGDEPVVVILGAHRMLDRAVAAHHPGRDLTLESQRPDQFLPRGVQRKRQPLAAIVGVHADIGAIQPVA